MNATIQQEKAILCRELGALVMRIPPPVASGSIQLVREWKHERIKAASVLKNKSSSLPAIKRQLERMQRFKA